MFLRFQVTIDQTAHELIPDGSKVKVTKGNAVEMVRYRQSFKINKFMDSFAFAKYNA